MGLQKLPARTDRILALSLLGIPVSQPTSGRQVRAVEAGDTFVVSGAAGDRSDLPG